MANSSKPVDPKKVTLLSAGIVVALGIAGWRIMDALAVDSAPASTASAQPAAASAPTPAPAGGSVAAAPVADLQASAAVPTGQSSEETLALSADPFFQLQTQPEPPKIAPPPASHRRGPDIFLPPGTGAAGTGVVSGPPTLPVIPTEPPAPPQLVGTVLADVPRAVFKTGTGIHSVVRGDMIQDWKVVSVDHGMVRLRAGKFSRSLTVNALTAAVQSTPSGGNMAEAAPMEMMAGLPATMVMSVSMPAPAPAAPALPAPLPEADPFLVAPDTTPAPATPAETPAPPAQPETR